MKKINTYIVEKLKKISSKNTGIQYKYMVEKLNKINNNSKFINGESYYIIIPYTKKINEICNELDWSEILFKGGNSGFVIKNINELKEHFKRRDSGKLYIILKFKSEKVKHIESYDDLVNLCNNEYYTLSDFCEMLDSEEINNIFQ